jgi:flavin-dependent dehydrogenase
MEQGADVRFGHAVQAFYPGEHPRVEVVDDAGHVSVVRSRFVLDASGFGRVLPRLLNLETPTRVPQRSALFTHVRDDTRRGASDRNKITIAVHPERRDVWFWLIPLAGDRFSVGCVAERAFLDVPEAERDALLRALIRQEPTLGALIGDAAFLLPVRHIGGYAANVAQLHGPGYALLGNAGEFLDPIFSSGVTIALRSAHLAAAALARQLQGEPVDWREAYDIPLRKGIDTFRAFVERWYSGVLQDIVFHPHQTPEIRRMISSVLAGYAWDESNPYVRDAGRRLDVLHRFCAGENVENRDAGPRDGALPTIVSRESP